ncbi:MAG: NifU family protein [Lachnotalea sp.]
MDKLKTYIAKTIAPKIQGDGGWIELVSSEGEKTTMRLQGECSKCIIAERCMKWVAYEVKRDLGLDINISIERKKPFFWDA